MPDRHPKRPCFGCPYARSTPAGGIRGVDPRRFIAQAHGPFLLPCHSAEERLGGTGWERLAMSNPQCAGAAMFRAAITPLCDSPQLLRLEHDPALVFSSADEMLRHHEPDAPKARVDDVLRWLLEELYRPGVRLVDSETE